MSVLLLLTLLCQEGKPNPYDQEGGLEVIIRGRCLFSGGPTTRLLELPGRRSLAGRRVLLHHPKGKREVVTGQNGEIPLNEPGIWTLSYPGDETHLPCRATRTVAAHSHRTHGKGNGAQWLFFGVAGLLLLISFRSPLVGLFRSKKRPVVSSERVTKEGVVQVSQEGFRLSQLFGGRSWRGRVVDGLSEEPIEGATVSMEPLKGGRGGETSGNDHPILTTTASGEFTLAARPVHLEVRCTGYRTQRVTLGGQGGELVVRLISLRHWALFLLKRIVARHDPDRAGSVTPGEALARAIPPPETLLRLEEIAYQGVAPNELEIIDLLENYWDCTGGEPTPLSTEGGAGSKTAV